MPLTSKGEKIKSAMAEQYGAEKGEQVFYASKNSGKIKGVDEDVDGCPSAPTGVGAVGGTMTPSGTVAGFTPSGGDFLPAIATIGARAAGSMVNPLASSSTASQAQENSVMGRPANAGSFGQTPVTGDVHRTVASLDDLARAGGRK